MGIKVHFTQLTLRLHSRDHVIMCLCEEHWHFSSCTELAKRKLGNAKKSIKYYWKYNSLQDICIWFYLSSYPDSEAGWDREAIKLEGLSIRNILVPAGAETARSSGATTNCNETISMHRLNGSRSIYPQVQPPHFSCRRHRHRGSAQRTHSQTYFMYQNTWLAFLVLCLLQLSASVNFIYAKYLSSC